jgi:hypothetical protein
VPVVELTPHATTVATPARRLTVEVRRTVDGEVSLAFGLEGRLDEIRVPPPAPASRTDGLWRHTCFEAFVGLEGQAAYRELNFAPSGAWAAYDFRAYRDALPQPDTTPPRIATRRTADRLDLDAAVALPATHARASLRIGLSAVVEAADGTLSYWALCHPTGAPDFHHADAFALRLPPPRPA